MNLRISLIFCLLFIVGFINAQTVLYDDPAGAVHTNTDGPVLDITPIIDISNCTSIEFSIDYEFPAGWDGGGNMESLDECCMNCDGDPETPTQAGCLQNMTCTGSVGCWDFMWIQFFIDGSSEAEDLIGDSGTTNADNDGTFTYIQCIDDEEEAHIEITNQNWAGSETNIYSNVTIICWEAQPTIEDLDEVCSGADLNLIGDAIDIGAVVLWEWSTDGTAIINDDMAQITFANGTGDGEEFTLTTTDPNGCTGEATVEAVVSSFDVNIDGGGVICEGGCSDEDSDFIIELTGGDPLYELSFNINGIPVPIAPAIDVDGVFRICSDPDLFLPDYDDNVDPPEIIIPSSFFPIELELISVIDAKGCTGNIINGSVDYELQEPPEIFPAISPPYCTEENGTVDLTLMDDNVDVDGFDVLWFEDEDLEDQISDPSQYNISNGSTVWAVVDDGDCLSEAVEIELDISIMPQILIIQNPITDCGSDSYILPQLEDVVNITSENSAGYYLDPNGQNGPVFEVDPNDVNQIYIYDASSPDCFDQVVIDLNLGIAPFIESPIDELAGCGSLELPEPDGSDIAFYEYNRDEDGTSDAFFEGDIIFASDNIETLFLIATSQDGCTTIVELEIILESLIEYMVDIDNLSCDSLVLPLILPSTGAEAYYTESMGMGMQLSAGDVLYPPFNDTLFIFDLLLDPTCASEDTVLVNFTSASSPVFPSDTSACEFIVLPEFGGIHGPNIRYAQFPIGDPNSTFYPGDTLAYTQLLFVLDTIGSCEFYDSMMVNIFVEPYIGLDSSLVICEGFESSSFNLMEFLSFPDQGGQWSYPNIPDLITDDSTNISFDVVLSGNYSFQYVIEDSICGLYNSEISLEVIPKAYGGMSASYEFCSDADDLNFMDLISNPETGGSWEQVMGPENIIIADSTSVDMTGLQNGSYGFLYIIEGLAETEFCEPESASLFIDLGGDVYAGSDTILSACQGEIIELTELLSNNADDNGFFEGDNVIFTGTSWNTSASPVDQEYLIQYIVVSNDMNCPNDTAFITINLLEQLSAGEAITPATSCEESIINLFDFITNSTPGGYFSLASSPSVQIPNAEWTFTETENFYYIIDAIGSCPSDSLLFSIELIENPSFNLSVLGSVLCNGNENINIEIEIDHISTDSYIYEFVLTDAQNNSVIINFDTLSSNDLSIQLAANNTANGSSGDTLNIAEGPGSYLLQINAYDNIGLCKDNQNIIIPIEVLDSYFETIDLELCEGESYEFNGQIYFDSQVFNIDGGGLACDSIVIYTITNYPQIPGSFDGIYCLGDTVTIFGVDYFNNIQSIETYADMASNSCDSLIELNILFESSVSTPIQEVLCEGDILEINNINYSITNPSGQDTLQSILGCDSILIINLTFNINSESDFINSICPDETIIIGSDEYDRNNLSGVTIIEDASANGCDSIVNVDLELLEEPTFQLSESICAGQNIIVGPDVYDANNLSGTTVLENASLNGCDSIVNVNLQLLSASSFNLNESICPGQSIIVGPDVYDADNLGGITILENESVNGCDSIVNVDLQLLSASSFNLNESICPGQSIIVGPDVYDADNLSGTTFLENASVNGCDSIVNVDLQLLSAVSSILNESICPGQSFLVGSDSYDENNLSGTTILNNGSVNGCDSIVNVNLELAIAMANIEVPIICPELTQANITIQSVDNMNLPISIIIDGVNQGDFNELPVAILVTTGSHTIEIIDQNNCMYEEIFMLDNLNVLDLEITAALISENIYSMNYQASFDLGDIEWISSGALSCSSCDNPTIEITEDTEVSLIASSTDDCDIMETFLLLYEEKQDSTQYYIPNIISLSEVGNDEFKILSATDLNIKEMSIYDRWGNLVYNNSDSVNPEISWDGRRGDKLVEQGVYVYKIIILMDNSEEKVIIGSLTIIR